MSTPRPPSTSLGAAVTLRAMRWGSHLSLRRAGARKGRITLSGPEHGGEGEPESGIDLLLHRREPTRGSREPVEPWLLLHGLGSTGACWTPILPELEDCRCLIPELSAIGGSRIPGGALALPQAPGALAELLEREAGGRPATVVGISLGGWMALRLALERPDLVERLVLINCAGWEDQDWDRIERVIRLDGPGGLDDLLDALYARPQTLFGPLTPLFRPILRPQLGRIYGSRAVQCILDTTDREHALDADDLARLEVPAALVWGEEDGLFHVPVARAMAEAIPEATLTVLPDAGHVLYVDDPQGLRRTVAELRRSWRSPIRSDPTAH